MERTAKPKHVHTTPGSHQEDPISQSPSATLPAHADRQEFYRDYREALKEYRAGKPERFLAYQEDPRIKAPLETQVPVSQAPTCHESREIVNAERIALATEVKVAVISLMASARSLTAAITSLFR